MKYFLIDEIGWEDMNKIEDYLKENSVQSEMEKLFWIKIPQKLLDDNQAEHKDCMPYMFAVELGRDFIKFELFLRSLNSFQCNYQGYLTDPQRSYVFDYAEKMIKRLEIRT